MGLLGKYAAYRWVTAGRGGGGGGASTGLVIFFAIFAIIIGVLWLTAEVLSFIWALIYGTVRPLLVLYPPVTVPLAVIIVVWMFTWIGRYPSETVQHVLDGDDDSLSFTGNAIWAIASINAFLIISTTESFPEPSGIVGTLLTLVVVFVLLYGMFEFFHLPYQCIRLLLHAPNGTRYVIAFLSPILFPLILYAFNVPFDVALSVPITLDSEWATEAGALAMVNTVHLGGILAVLWRQDAIRDNAFEMSHDTDQRKTNQTPSSQ